MMQNIRVFALARSLPALLLAASLMLSACATQEIYSSGRLARITPKDFIEIKPEQIAVGVDLDSRVPATPNRGPELLMAVLPVDHDAWEPIGARLRMRPINIGTDSPDPAAGKSMRAWMEAPSGRIRLTYVLTDESRTELAGVQRQFDDLLKKFPPSAGKKLAIRISADTRFLVGADQQTGNTQTITELQLGTLEGPFTLWEGRINQMR